MAVDPGTVAIVLVAIVGAAAGVGLVAFTERQGLRGKSRGNREPCFECDGTGKQACSFCSGTGKMGGTSTTDPCFYCEGVGTTTCSNCDGSGVQPRYLDRLRPEDFMD